MGRQRTERLQITAALRSKLIEKIFKQVNIYLLLLNKLSVNGIVCTDRWRRRTDGIPFRYSMGYSRFVYRISSMETNESIFLKDRTGTVLGGAYCRNIDIGIDDYRPVGSSLALLHRPFRGSCHW